MMYLEKFKQLLHLFYSVIDVNEKLSISELYVLISVCSRVHMEVANSDRERLSQPEIQGDKSCRHAPITHKTY
jgi:hypothetical protein